MNILLNIVVLIFEVLYYSLFMKFSRNNGKFYKYLINSIITTILLFFIGSNSLYGLLILVLSLFLGIKYIVRDKTSLFDMFFIVIILFLKILIEYICVLLMFNIFNINYIIVTFIFTIFKFLTFIILICKNRLNKIYNYLKLIWNKNNFYIRYLFSIFLFIYSIISILTILLY